MASVSQNGRRARRPWTAQDQIFAEVAAACGVSVNSIGRMLNRSNTCIKRHLSPILAEKERENVRRWRRANPEKMYESQRRWREANSQRASEQCRLWRKANPDRFRKGVIRWQKANADKVREISRRSYQSNRDKVLERQRQYRSSNAEKIRQRRNRWRKVNPEKTRQSDRRRAAWKRASRRQALQPVMQHQIDARFALWKNRCAFCGVDANHERNHGRRCLTVEHVLALTKGGLDEAANIIPACSACNCSKNNSPVENWYRQQPWFTDQRWRKIQRHCPAAVVGQLPLALAA